MRAAVFDLDGTLVDSAPDIHAAANAALAAQGLGAITHAQTVEFLGDGSEVFVARMMAALDLPENATLHAELYRSFIVTYEKDFALTRPFTGIEATLRALQAAGWALGLCTNKPTAPTHALLDHFGLAPYFPIIVCGDTLPQRKPDPAPLFHAVHGLGAESAVYVGDSEVDAQTATEAALPFVLFTRGYRNLPVARIAHDAAFDDFTALPAHLDALAQPERGAI